jgi:hypothetical protein
MNTYESETQTAMVTPVEAANGAISDMQTNHVEAIETVISSLDQYNNVLVNHSQEGHIWKFKYGSVDVWVQLTGSTDDDTFTVWSPVLELPVQEEVALMRRLMEMNWLDTFEARFGMFNNQVVVVTSRGVFDLSPGEISHLITIVATIADDHDEELQSAFPAISA